MSTKVYIPKNCKKPPKLNVNENDKDSVSKYASLTDNSNTV